MRQNMVNAVELLLVLIAMAIVLVAEGLIGWLEVWRER